MEEDVIASIRKVLQDYFSNLAEVKGTDKQWHNCKTAVKHILDSLKDLPSIVLKQDDSNKGSSRDFSRWLLVQLLRIVGEPKCLEIHTDVLNMLQSILVDYRCRCYLLYEDVIKELTRAFVAAADVRLQLDDNDKENMDQCSLLLFTGREVLVRSSSSPVSISLVDPDKCDSALTAILALLIPHYTGLGRRMQDQILTAAGCIVEVCEPELKASALQLTSKLIAKDRPDELEPGYNYLMDLATHLLTCPDADISITTEVCKQVKTFLKVCLCGSETWISPPKRYLSWIRIHDIISDRILPALSEPSSVFKDFALECLRYVYSTWHVAKWEVHEEVPTTPPLLELVLGQLQNSNEQLVIECVVSLLSASDERMDIEDKFYSPTWKILDKKGITSAKRSQENDRLIKILISKLDASLLRTLDRSGKDSWSQSGQSQGGAAEGLRSGWRTCVAAAIKCPGVRGAVIAKAEEVVITIDTLYSDSTSECCLQLLGDTLLLYRAPSGTAAGTAAGAAAGAAAGTAAGTAAGAAAGAAAVAATIAVPDRVKEVAKKIMSSFNIAAVSETHMSRALHCYVLLNSHRDLNLQYFLDPLATPKGVACVLPLIQLFSQMRQSKVASCIQCMVNKKPVLTEMATHLDQIVLAYEGGKLEMSSEHVQDYSNMFSGLRYKQRTDTAEVPMLGSSTAADLLSLLISQAPPACLIAAIKHLPLLAQRFEKEELLKALVPLILHPDMDVRRTLARSRFGEIGRLSQSPSQAKDARLSETQKSLLHNLKKAHDKGDDFKLTSIATVVSLACDAGLVLMKELLPPLIFGVMDEDSGVTLLVMEGLSRIAESQGLNSTAELFDRYNVTICDITTRRILQQPEGIVSFLEIVSGAFFSSRSVASASYLLARNRQHIVPIVVHFGSQNPQQGEVARGILQTLADSTNQTVKSLILKNFAYVFCYIARFSKQQESPFAFVENTSGMILSELMQTTVQPIFNTLVLYLARDKAAAVWGLDMLQANTATTTTRKRGRNDARTSDLSALIDPRLMGILAYFSTLQLGRFCEETYLVLESLLELMGLFPSAMLTKWKNKILSIMRNGLNSKDSTVRYESLLAWGKFSRVCEPRCVGPLVGEIVAVILPYIKSFPDMVIRTVKLLLVDRWKELKEHVGDIGWLTLPRHPDLTEVEPTLAQVKPGDIGTEAGFAHALRSHIHGVTRESGEVRVHTLQSLQMLLHANQNMIHRMVMERETVDAVMTELVSTLLCGVRDPDPGTRLLFATCIGEIGAVDAGLLDSAISTLTSNHKVLMEGIEDESFGVDLLNVLTRGYRNSSDQETEDKYAFAIQEVLSAYRECSNAKFQKMRSKFDEAVIEIIDLHIDSKYRLQSHQCPDLVSPVYKPDITFRKWLSTWSSLLLKMVAEGNKDKLAGLLIEPLKIITSTQTGTLQYLLPILVLQVLIQGSTASVDFVLAEIQAVLYATQNSTVKCDERKLIAQTVFSLLDYVTKWINRKRASAYKSEGKTKLLNRVDTNLAKISKHVVAVAAFNCGAYNRALMYLEYKNKLTEQADWELLQRIYVEMSEFDGVAGVTASRNTPASLKEQIQALETGGKLQQTRPMYEQAITQYPEDLFFLEGLLKHMSHMGQHTTLLDLVNSRIQKQPLLVNHLNEYRVEAAWSLARWETVEEYLASAPPHKVSWSVGVGRQFLAAKNLDKAVFSGTLEAMRHEQLIPLSAAVMEGGCYERCYENILNLHMLRDIEDWAKTLLFRPANPDALTNKTSEFERRMSMVQDCWRTREPVHNLHRSLLRLVADTDAHSALGSSWLQSATLARREMLIPCCNSALQNASLYNPPQFKIERSQWLWCKGDREEAMTLLKGHLNEIRGPPNVKKRVGAEARLLYAKWVNDTSYYETEDTKKLFSQVKDMDNEWEEAHFQLGSFYYKWSKAVSPGMKLSIMPHIIKHYGESLKYGSNNIFQSMPRMLTTWFELEGSEKHDVALISASQAASKPGLTRVSHTTIAELIESLPTYQWLTALSQILSRITHPSESVRDKLVEIASIVLYEYPQQTFWKLYSMVKHSDKDRTKLAELIIRGALQRYKKKPLGNRDQTWFKTFYSDFNKLCNGLLEISRKDCGSNTSLSVNKEFRTFRKMLEDPRFSQIILPIQRNTTVTLPVGPGPNKDHAAFPHHLVTIKSIKDHVMVLASLQRPKKITIIGSDGKEYGLLCKPKDDLRKDCRFMEFNMMVNRLLKKDAVARKKQLHIRTYAVIPLTENSGIVEWVNDTVLLRTILRDLYSEAGKGLSKSETSSVFAKLQAIKQRTPAKQKSAEFIDLFRKKVLPLHPAVLAEWFRRTFPDPSCWFTARLKYTQTTAVVSMVGYVVGLGDRHAENIMFDQTTGETVHVDFDCLFEKGDTFEWPERVPFRLTHNMEDAFGVTGVEGTFRLSCVATMRVMRNEREALISVLKTFVHDPLVEWAKHDRRTYQAQLDRGKQSIRSDRAQDIMKDKAQEIMRAIERKLVGQMGKNASAKLPISTEGQVQKLISESTDVANLSQMYIGWAPYY